MPCRAVRRLTRQLGRRGAILTLKGTISTLYGYAQVVQPTGDPDGLALLLKAWPLAIWGWLWVAAGVIALVCAWLPSRWDWPGFLAVWLMATPWAMAYLLSWWPLGQSPHGWVPAVIWGAFGSVCLVVIGWDEQPPRRTEPARGA